MVSYCYEYCPLCGLENVHIFSAPVFFSTRLLAAMYDIGNSWCEAELNTVLAVVVLPPPRWLLIAGFVRLNSAICRTLAGTHKVAQKIAARCCCILKPPCGCVRQIAEFSRTKPGVGLRKRQAQRIYECFPTRKEGSSRNSLTPRVLNIVPCH